MNNNILLSIVVPCRNEEKYIGECLSSIVKNDYPKNKLEVLVVDGMSEDGTREIIKEYSKKNAFVTLIDNPKKITPVAMNIGIKESRGDYVLILSSHSKIGKNFLRINLESIEKYAVDCVGGILITLSANNSLTSKAIAFAISNPFGVGNSYFRIGSKESKYVDTVPFGCYRKEVFKKIGFFDEELIRNQDDEFNMRLIKNDGKILLVPDIVSYYYARDSIVKLWKMYFQYGYFKPLVSLKIGAVLTTRQVIPAAFIGSLVISLVLSIMFKQLFWIFVLILSLYLTFDLFFSLQIVIEKGLNYLPILPIVFSTLHLSYGIGYLRGIWDFIVLKKHKRKKIDDVPLSR
jgi:cellulose synthase/poly-beta-1,6-N-acetylglucosamine synthase-like glycosyltransferase